MCVTKFNFVTQSLTVIYYASNESLNYTSDDLYFQMLYFQANQLIEKSVKQKCFLKPRRDKLIFIEIDQTKNYTSDETLKPLGQIAQ